MTDILLQIYNVTKRYRTKKGVFHALDGISLDIYKAEVLALLGVNGAGKTTLSSILATLHPPTSGQILYLGTSIYEVLLSYRQAIGFCPQKPNLDHELSVRDNLVFAGRYFLFSHKETQERTDELMHQFGLEKYADFNVKALSGGYKQRLLIARAIFHKPRLVIFDEPTVGLDPDIRREIWQIIKELRNKGITIIFTTHYLEEAQILSDRVCILNKGRILMIATMQELIERHERRSLEEIFLQLISQQESDDNK